MLRRLYDWTLSLARSPGATRALAAISFAESSFFPVPPDVLLIPMVLAERTKAWLYGTVTTVASVLGGLFGYAIGYFLLDTIGRPIIDFYGYTEEFHRFAGLYNEYGAWIVFAAGLTPLPYKVVTIASGVTMLNLPAFMLASVASRGLRFYAVTALLYWFGPPIRDLMDRYLNWVFWGFVALAVGGFVVLPYLW